MPQALRIIQAVLEKYGTYESFEVATGGRLLSKCQIWSIIRKYMQKEGCLGEVTCARARGQGWLGHTARISLPCAALSFPSASPCPVAGHACWSPSQVPPCFQSLSAFSS